MKGNKLVADLFDEIVAVARPYHRVPGSFDAYRLALANALAVTHGAGLSTAQQMQLAKNIDTAVAECVRTIRAEAN